MQQEVDDVVATLGSSPHQQPPVGPPPPLFDLPEAHNVGNAADYERTDLGNMHYFIDLFGHVIRFDQARKRWLVWRRHRWEPDSLRRVDCAAQRAARRRLTEALNVLTTRNSEALKWALQSENRARIESVIALAQTHEVISVSTVTGWDSDPWLLAVPNGVIELKTGRRRDGRQEDRITRQAAVEFDPKATCPRWTRFVSEVLNDDMELITFTRRAIGYTLTGDVREDVWFGAWGDGSNGKSTLFKVLDDVLGEYGYVAPFSLVEKGRGDNKRDFDIANLQNMRFVMASEASEGGYWDEERLKRLSGGDTLHAEIKFGPEFNFDPTHKLWFMFNHRPRVRDHSHGFWRRVRLIPFLQKFQGARDDKTLPEKLHSERAGILAWAVRACLEWQQYGLPVPQAVLEAGADYETKEDTLSEFLNCHVDPSGPGFYLRDVFKLYSEWTKSEGLTGAFGRNRFGDLLESRGFKRGTKRNRPYFLNGRLKFICVCQKTPCVCYGSP